MDEPLVAGHGNDLEPSGLEQRNDAERRTHMEVDASRDELLVALGRALVGNRRDPDSGELFEPLGEQVLRRSGAQLHVVELAGMLFRVGDQLGKGPHRQRVRDRDRVTVAGEQRDAEEIGELVAEVLVEQRVDGVEISAGQQVVAVARPRHHLVGGERRGGARPVLDDDGLAERGAEALGDEARRDVGRSGHGDPTRMRIGRTG